MTTVNTGIVKKQESALYFGRVKNRNLAEGGGGLRRTALRSCKKSDRAAAT